MRKLPLFLSHFISRFIVIALVLALAIVPVIATANTVAVSFSPTSLSGQAVDIEQNNVYTYAKLFSTGYTGSAVIPNGTGLIAYTANLTAPSTSISEIQILSTAGQILSTAKGNGWYVQDSFDFSFVGESEYVMELYYSQSNVGSSIATTSNGVLAESSDGYVYALSTNSQYSGTVFTTTQNITSSTLQAVIDITELIKTPPPSDGIVHFVESGLPTGTSWSVTYHTVLNGYTGANSSTSSKTPYINLTMALGNTIYYWISIVNGLTPTPSSGIISLSQYNMTVNVAYPTPTPKSFSVTFVPVGIPSGNTWAVTLNGLQLFQTNLNGQNPDISFTEGNGSYSYSVYVPSPLTASPSTGTVTVSGSAVTVDITIVAPVKDYTLTFSETGLPSGVDFTVSTAPGSASGNPSASFSVPNGTYGWTIANVVSNSQTYTPSPNSGFVTVNGASVTVSIQFATQSYQVVFSETGLPAGTWFVNLTNGQTFSTSSTSLSFNEPDGTYSYSVSTSNPAYAPSVSSGGFTVSGAAVSVGVTFMENTYSVTFTETGLPASTLWEVTLGTASRASSTSSITFTSLLPQTYSYVAMATGYNNIYGNVSIVASSPKSIFVSINLISIQFTGPPSVSITSSQNYFINGTVTPPNGYPESSWATLDIIASATSYDKTFSLSPPQWNFSLQVPELNVTYSLSFRLAGNNILSDYYNTTVKMSSSSGYTPTYFAISPPSGTTIYSSQAITLYLRGNVSYSAILTYSSPLATSGSIVLARHSLTNGTQSFTYSLNISKLPSSSYVFKFFVIYQNKTVSAFTAQYYVDGVNAITLRFSYNYITQSSGLYNTYWNVSEVDNSSNSYASVNVLDISIGSRSIGFVQGKQFTRDGMTRDYFVFAVYNLSRGTYNLTVGAYNKTGNMETRLFTQNFSFSVPELAPPSTSGFFNQTYSWLQQGYNGYIAGGIAAILVIGVIYAYSTGSFTGSRIAPSQGGTQNQRGSSGVNIRIVNGASRTRQTRKKRSTKK